MRGSSSGRGSARTFELAVTLLIKQEGKEYTALCLELDIASCGSTESEAAASLKGLIELYVEDCVAEGEIPIPLRPVALDALRGFLSPADRQGKLRLTARQESFPHHVLA